MSLGDRCKLPDIQVWTKPGYQTNAVAFRVLKRTEFAVQSIILVIIFVPKKMLT